MLHSPRTASLTAAEQNYHQTMPNPPPPANGARASFKPPQPAPDRENISQRIHGIAAAREARKAARAARALAQAARGILATTEAAALAASAEHSAALAEQAADWLFMDIKSTRQRADAADGALKAVADCRQILAALARELRLQNAATPVNEESPPADKESPPPTKSPPPAIVGEIQNPEKWTRQDPRFRPGND